MIAAEFARCVKLAQDKKFDSVDCLVLDGVGTRDFQPVQTTAPIVASFLRHQAQMFNGQWDSVELEECRNMLRRKVTLAT